jgi:hypothetical protein
VLLTEQHAMPIGLHLAPADQTRFCKVVCV